MDKEIGKINKNDTTDIILRIDDFGGRRGLTIREFVTSERYTGFTKSGVRILADDFLKFREMLNSISLQEMTEAVTKDEAPAQAKPAEPTPGQETLNKEEEKPKEGLPDY
ncbi:hypothetical protein GOV13_05050 [Candidatus Pacearchaeota archaeon]|nr:hypothetical protein [Candidatus Pacearchaeota archaeon]